MLSINQDFLAFLRIWSLFVRHEMIPCLRFVYFVPSTPSTLVKLLRSNHLSFQGFMHLFTHRAGSKVQLQVVTWDMWKSMWSVHTKYVKANYEQPLTLGKTAGIHKDKQTHLMRIKISSNSRVYHLVGGFCGLRTNTGLWWHLEVTAIHDTQN